MFNQEANISILQASWAGGWSGLANQFSNYETATFTIASGQTNVSVREDLELLRNIVEFPRYIKIISSHDIWFRLNDITNWSYPMTSGQSPYEIYISPLEDIFISTGWSNTTITIVLMS